MCYSTVAQQQRDPLIPTKHRESIRLNYFAFDGDNKEFQDEYLKLSKEAYEKAKKHIAENCITMYKMINCIRTDNLFSDNSMIAILNFIDLNQMRLIMEIINTDDVKCLYYYAIHIFVKFHGHIRYPQPINGFFVVYLNNNLLNGHDFTPSVRLETSDEYKKRTSCVGVRLI